jgi:hypothetical protein
MKFSREDYWKLTNDQKAKLRLAKGLNPLPFLSSDTTVKSANTTITVPTVVTTTTSTPESSASHLRQVLSNRNVRTTTDSTASPQLDYNGSTYQRITNMVNITYCLTHALQQQHQQGALIYGGTNGGMSGNDLRVL